MDAQNHDELLTPDAQARAWLVRLHSGAATSADLDAFGSWRRGSGANEVAYRESLSMWRLLGPAIARAGDDLAARPPAPRLSRRQWLAGAGLAATGAAVLAVGITLPTAPAGATVIETAKGERKRTRFDDGVIVEINTDSRLWSLVQGDRRELQLERGEAIIATGGAARRLVARAGDTEVTADRARFLLRLVDGAPARVLCLSGSVAVRVPGGSATLDARQALAGSNAIARPEAAVAEAIAWERGVLVFQGRPASEVVGELNRYRPGRIILPASHAAIPISGVIHLDNADASVDHVARSLGLSVVRLPAGIVLLRA